MYICCIFDKQTGRQRRSGVAGGGGWWRWRRRRHCRNVNLISAEELKKKTFVFFLLQR